MVIRVDCHFHKCYSPRSWNIPFINPLSAFVNVIFLWSDYIVPFKTFVMWRNATLQLLLSVKYEFEADWSIYESHWVWTLIFFWSFILLAAFNYFICMSMFHIHFLNYMFLHFNSSFHFKKKYILKKTSTWLMLEI